MANHATDQQRENDLAWIARQAHDAQDAADRALANVIGAVVSMSADGWSAYRLSQLTGYPQPRIARMIRR